MRRVRIACLAASPLLRLIREWTYSGDDRPVWLGLALVKRKVFYYFLGKRHLKKQDVLIIKHLLGITWFAHALSRRLPF
jgi:hypothetical protein